MCEEELVVLYNEDKDVYCKHQTFAFGSEEAKKAHESIQKIRQVGCQIIDVENMTEEEMNIFLEKIDAKIQKYEVMNTLDVNMIIHSRDLDSFFGPDGFCYIENLKCATPEIKELVNNPEKIGELQKIKEVPYIADYIPDSWGITGYMIPMIAYGDFFSLDEAKNIVSLNPIDTSRDGLHCQFGLNPIYTQNLSFMADAEWANRSNASDEDKKTFELKKQYMFEEYKLNYESIKSYKDTKEQVLEIYFRNSKKM